MFCQQTQNNINALLRLKVGNENKTMVHRFGSYTDSIATRPIQCAKSISELMNNKVASTAVKKVGELAEFQSLLKAYIRT